MQRIGDTWRSGKAGKLVVMVGMLFMACAFCSVLVVLVPSSDEPEISSIVERDRPGAENRPAEPGNRQETANEVAPPTDPVPTDNGKATAIAEAARVRATATARTAKARATATAIAGSAARLELAGELAYRSEILEIAELYLEALGGIEAQSMMAASSPSVVVDQDWIITTSVYLAGMRVANDQIRELNPPARFQSAHAELEKAADYFDLAVKYYAEGVDELDPNKLQIAVVNMDLGSEAISRATKKLETLTNP